MEHRRMTGYAAPSELRLVERARCGDGAAFGELVSGLEPRLLSTAHGVVGNWADAEDAVQDAMWKAYERLDSYRAEASFSAWLTRITFNQALAMLRRRHSRPIFAASAVDDQTAPPDAAASVEKAALANEIAQLVEEAIGQMRPAYRELMHLWAFDELEYAEIARRLGLNLGVVKSRIYRGRITLKRVLGARLDSKRQNARRAA